MPESTKFGVVYSVGSAIIRRYIYPDSDAELNVTLCGPGEAITIVDRGPYPDRAAWEAAVRRAVLAAAGKEPGDPRCYIIGKDNEVITTIMADAEIDSLPDATLVQVVKL